MNRVYIGTSGWVYKGWQKTFYPESVPQKDHFQYYATQFPTVEINATFYRLPTLKMVRGWRDKAPEGFTFAVKGSRFITHIKKLENLDGALAKYFGRIKPLDQRVGVFLWQLPPFMKKDTARLAKFLKRLPKKHRHAVEFRHPSWLDAETFALLRRFGAAHVSVSSQKMPMDLTVTSDLVYIRFHGLEGGGAHDYSKDELQPWAAHILQHARAGRTVYAYFNNDANVRAPSNARLLMDMAGKYAVRPTET